MFFVTVSANFFRFVNWEKKEYHRDYKTRENIFCWKEKVIFHTCIPDSSQTKQNSITYTSSSVNPMSHIYLYVLKSDTNIQLLITSWRDHKTSNDTAVKLVMCFFAFFFTEKQNTPKNALYWKYLYITRKNSRN